MQRKSLVLDPRLCGSSVSFLDCKLSESSPEVDLGFPKGGAKLGASTVEAKKCGNWLIQLYSNAE